MKLKKDSGICKTTVNSTGARLTIEVITGLFVYLRVARLIGIEELEPVRLVLRRFKLTWI
ncbi:MAG TPA: hypothetical protein VIZ18_16890 [Ktedonobacteraceae bacterium]